MSAAIKWLWKMTSVEKSYQPYAISYQLTLVTREPLREETVVLVLRHLFRKVSLLRTCFAERDGEMWLREMEKEIIDFEVLQDVRGDDLHRMLQDYDFNKETGPLWCVRLRPEPQCKPDGHSREEVPGFPHMYSLFFGINHAITDGTSNIAMSGYIAQVLDDVLGGKVINDDEELGFYISDERTRKLIRDQETVLNSDPELKRQVLENYKTLQGHKSIAKSVLKGEGEGGKSMMMSRELDPVTTAAFIKRCRAEGVTVNSAFTAVASLAMVDILAEEGLQQDSYRIRSDYVLSARRYWEGDTSDYLGCHLLSFAQLVAETPRHIGGNFWPYAKDLNEKLYGRIVRGKPLLGEVVNTIVDKTPDPSFEHDFVVTNMGEVTRKVAKGGNHVHVVHVLRTAAIHHVPMPIALFVHTFRGRLVNTLMYNTLFITSEVAQKFNERIFHHLSQYI